MSNRSMVMCRLALAMVATLLVAAPGAQAADGEKLAVNEQVDTRLGLIDNDLRIWKIPRRYTPGKSPYFRPGLPPYRQQPEEAQEQPSPEPEVAESPAPPPPGSSGGGSSASDEVPSSDNGSDSSDNDDGGGDTDPGFGPTPICC